MTLPPDLQERMALRRVLLEALAALASSPSAARLGMTAESLRRQFNRFGGRYTVAAVHAALVYLEGRKLVERLPRPPADDEDHWAITAEGTAQVEGTVERDPGVL